MVLGHCRLLGLGPEAQRRIFDYYQQTLEALMEQARQGGRLGEWAGWGGSGGLCGRVDVCAT